MTGKKGDPIVDISRQVGVSGELPEERRRTQVSVSFIGSHGAYR